MQRREVFGLALVALIGLPLIGGCHPRIPMPRMFALVYTKGSKHPRRTIDTAEDADDSFLVSAHAVLADDEIMELFPQHQFNHPVRYPRFVMGYIGEGVIV